MPIKYSKEKRKWCFGKLCTFSSKEDAEKAQRAYYASKDKKVNKDMNNVDMVEELVLKATADDKRNYLNEALREKYKTKNSWIWLQDYEDSYVYFTMEDYNTSNNLTFRSSYTISGVNVTLSDDLVIVKRETTYTPVEDQTPVEDYIGSKIMKSMKDLFQEYFPKVSEKTKELPVIKQFHEDEQIAIEPMYCGPMQVDGHGEYMTEETIRGMVESANTAIEKGKLSGGVFHKENLDEIEILKAWVNECDCMIGDTEVPEGQPIVKVKFHDTDLWNLRKEGKLRGLSIGGKKKPLEKDNG